MRTRVGGLGRRGAVSIERQFDCGLTGSAITEQDLENYPVWIWDGVHMLSCPESKGWQWKHLNGHVHMAVIEPKPEEVLGREKMFPERMMPFVDDPVGGWAGDSAEAMRLYQRIQEVDIAEVIDLEPRELFYEAIHSHRRACEIRFKWTYSMFNVDALFSTVSEELTGIKRGDPIHATR